MIISKLIDRFRKKKKEQPHHHILKAGGRNLGNEYIQIEDDRPGNYKASFNVQLATPTDTNIRFKVYTDGNGGIIFGNNQRIKIDETGLTDVRTYTFPDTDTKLVGSTMDTITVGPSQSTPSNPAINYSKIYVKQVDSHNDGIFTIIKKNDLFVEVQIL